ncbi:MAG: hypothetical protein OEW35_04290 [Gammaproteobacteria bacterium]|nr:hypothetical protein [Gammaproteobacteria bacterium]MDH4255814.1 hypothetical protein [Gammaproteobacteria bacterium]MDH5311034.1 hypothetical protein [Gammaproteobacteria bacterium]
MTPATEQHSRVFIALTESCPVPRLWQAALEQLRESPAELTALFVVDERWYRAAELPGTLEISRLSAAPFAFTRERAEAICREAAARTRRDIERMAAEARLRLRFEVLREATPALLADLLAGEQGLVIASSQFRLQPAYTLFEGLRCRVLLVDDDER